METVRYEYKVEPAPRRPQRVRGVKGDEARFAFTIEETINLAAAEGWEYVRSETLPCEHRGWFRRSTDEQTVLIFRRGKADYDGLPGIPTAPLKHAEPRLAADRDPPRRTNSGVRVTAASERIGEPR